MYLFLAFVFVSILITCDPTWDSATIGTIRLARGLSNLDDRPPRAAASYASLAALVDALDEGWVG